MKLKQFKSSLRAFFSEHWDKQTGRGNAERFGWRLQELLRGFAALESFGIPGSHINMATKLLQSRTPRNYIQTPF